MFWRGLPGLLDGRLDPGRNAIVTSLGSSVLGVGTKQPGTESRKISQSSLRGSVSAN